MVLLAQLWKNKTGFFRFQMPSSVYLFSPFHAGFRSLMSLLPFFLLYILSGSIFPTWSSKHLIQVILLDIIVKNPRSLHFYESRLWPQIFRLQSSSPSCKSPDFWKKTKEWPISKRCPIFENSVDFLELLLNWRKVSRIHSNSWYFLWLFNNSCKMPWPLAACHLL